MAAVQPRLGHDMGRARQVLQQLLLGSIAFRLAESGYRLEGQTRVGALFSDDPSTTRCPSREKGNRSFRAGINRYLCDRNGPRRSRAGLDRDHGRRRSVLELPREVLSADVGRPVHVRAFRLCGGLDFPCRFQRLRDIEETAQALGMIHRLLSPLEVHHASDRPPRGRRCCL